MTTGQVTQIGKEMLVLAMYLGAPVIVIGMVAGLIVSIFQTVTQIQEQSISFVLKLIASAAALIITAPWMLRKTIDFTASLLGHLDKFAR